MKNIKIVIGFIALIIFVTADKTDGASRINKWMALLLQSRVALFEGTWEKYHNGMVTQYRATHFSKDTIQTKMKNVNKNPE